MNVLFLCLRQLCLDRGFETVFVQVGLPNMYKQEKLKANKVRCL